MIKWVFLICCIAIAMLVCYQSGEEAVRTEYRKAVISCHYSLGSVPFQEIDDFFGLDWKEYKFDNAFTAYVDHKLYECVEDRL